MARMMFIRSCRREEINQGSCRDPNDPSRDEQGSRVGGTTFAGERCEERRKPFFGIEIAEDGLRETEEWAPDKLVDEFFGDGGRIRAVAKKWAWVRREGRFPSLEWPKRGRES